MTDSPGPKGLGHWQIAICLLQWVQAEKNAYQEYGANEKVREPRSLEEKLKQ
jgi:hypothetical protein